MADAYEDTALFLQKRVLDLQARLAEVQSDRLVLESTLRDTRRFIVMACGETGPMVKIMLGRIDAALAPKITADSAPAVDLRELFDLAYDHLLSAGYHADGPVLTMLAPHCTPLSAPADLEGWCGKCGARGIYPSAGSHPCRWSDCDGTVTVTGSAPAVAPADRDMIAEAINGIAAMIEADSAEEGAK